MPGTIIKHMLSTGIIKLLLGALLFSPAGSMEPVVTAKLTLASSTVVAGKSVRGTATVTIPAGWHAYAPPAPDGFHAFNLKGLNSGFGFKASYPAGKPLEVAGQEGTVMVYEGTVKVPVTITVPSKAKKGRTTLKMQVDYQLCDDSTCLRPDSKTVTATVTVK